MYELDVECDQRHTPHALPPEKIASTTRTGCGGPQGRSGWGEESLSPPHRESIPDRATCSESPYLLSCRGLLLQKEAQLYCFLSFQFRYFLSMDTNIEQSGKMREAERSVCVIVCKT